MPGLRRSYRSRPSLVVDNGLGAAGLLGGLSATDINLLSRGHAEALAQRPMHLPPPAAAPVPVTVPALNTGAPGSHASGLPPPASVSAATAAAGPASLAAALTGAFGGNMLGSLRSETPAGQHQEAPPPGTSLLSVLGSKPPSPTAAAAAAAMVQSGRQLSVHAPVRLLQSMISAVTIVMHLLKRRH